MKPRVQLLSGTSMISEASPEDSVPAVVPRADPQRLAAVGRQLQQAFIRSLHDDPFADLLVRLDEPRALPSGESRSQMSDLPVGNGSRAA